MLCRMPAWPPGHLSQDGEGTLPLGHPPFRIRVLIWSARGRARSCAMDRTWLGAAGLSLLGAKAGVREAGGAAASGCPAPYLRLLLLVGRHQHHEVLTAEGGQGQCPRALSLPQLPVTPG